MGLFWQNSFIWVKIWIYLIWLKGPLRVLIEEHGRPADNSYSSDLDFSLIPCQQRTTFYRPFTSPTQTHASSITTQHCLFPAAICHLSEEIKIDCLKSCLQDNGCCHIMYKDRYSMFHFEIDILFQMDVKTYSAVTRMGTMLRSNQL